MAVSLAAIALAFAIGTTLGILAAVLSTRAERFFLILFDVISAFPSLVLALAVVAVFGPSNTQLIGIVAVTLVPQFGRVARAQALSLRSAPFLEAERILGASAARIMASHMLPNIAAPLIVLASLEIPAVITIEAGLSFIGLGVRPPIPDWGLMLSTLRQSIYIQPWVCAVPGAAIFLTSMCFNLVSDGLRSAMDVRIK